MEVENTEHGFKDYQNEPIVFPSNDDRTRGEGTSRETAGENSRGTQQVTLYSIKTLQLGFPMGRNIFFNTFYVVRKGGHKLS